MCDCKTTHETRDLLRAINRKLDVLLAAQEAGIPDLTYRRVTWVSNYTPQIRPGFLDNAPELPKADPLPINPREWKIDSGNNPPFV